jgi:putative transposase
MASGRWRPRVSKSVARARAAKAAAAAKPKPGDQLNLADAKTWGGPRAGSGRKAAIRANVRHRTRPQHYADCPVHVTMRRAKGLPSFRSERLRKLLEQAIRDTRRDGFRIVEYSVQADHLHILIEAEDPTALTNGMRSFSVRVAMRVNARILGRRRGRVWGDRYHRRDLGTPSEVRKALVYVLNNHIKHGEWEIGLVDPCSSAPWFTGWMHYRDPRPPDPSPTEPPRTWLLEKGWSTVGLGFLHIGEVPSAVWR